MGLLQPKSVLKSKKSEFEDLLEDYETTGASTESPELSPHGIILDSPTENNVSSLPMFLMSPFWQLVIVLNFMLNGDLMNYLHKPFCLAHLKRQHSISHYSL